MIGGHEIDPVVDGRCSAGHHAVRPTTSRGRSTYCDARERASAQSAAGMQPQAACESGWAGRRVQLCSAEGLRMAPRVSGASHRSRRSHSRARCAHFEHALDSLTLSRASCLSSAAAHVERRLERERRCDAASVPAGCTDAIAATLAAVRSCESARRRALLVHDYFFHAFVACLGDHHRAQLGNPPPARPAHLPPPSLQSAWSAPGGNWRS